jgi:hypothetical protein
LENSCSERVNSAIAAVSLAESVAHENAVT